MNPERTRSGGSNGRPAGPSGGARDNLLRVAAEMFCAKGYGTTTTRELADRLGIQKASLYHHIRSKEELLLEISLLSLARIREAVTAGLESSHSRSADSRTRLREAIVAHVRAALADREMHTVMLIELRSLTSAHRDRVMVERDGYESVLRQLVAEAQAAGVVRAGSVDLYTLALLNLLNWTIFWYHPSGPRSPEEIGEFLASVFLDGAGLPPVAAASDLRHLMDGGPG
jgi:TetR/AcrR family transcriptional regulator, cholesterol catabolism regulator